MTAFPDHYFRRQDPSSDHNFYSIPRKVVHIDDHAIAAVQDFLGDLLPPGGAYLDLMSSWRSHLPEHLNPSRVVGLGMNADEMADNPQLTEHLVQSLNDNPTLPFADGEFDGAFCTVSVQYLTRPVEVFAEVKRVLKSGSVFAVSFSNRCFPTKAVAIWLNNTDQGHLDLVTQYFEASGGWASTETRQRLGRRTLFGGNDPLYMVFGRKAAT